LLKTEKKGNILQTIVAGQTNLKKKNSSSISSLLIVLHDPLGTIDKLIERLKIKVYGWKAVDMAKNLTYEQLKILSSENSKGTFNSRKSDGQILIFTIKKGEIDVLSWAVHYKQKSRRLFRVKVINLRSWKILRIRKFQKDYEQAFDKRWIASSN
jgi:hypothetical protein